MNKQALGRMKKVSLREFWETEDEDFTPWLGQSENIKLLAETIDIDLEVEAQEKNVGPFRADILCKDTVSNNWVLIENQLEKTDHTHLGQLLTYAAGLNAVTIVWISEYFTEEHRATMDWLNEITDGRFNFFGLEIELWRIGESPLAPKFNIVSKPNDWSKTVTKSANQLQSQQLTETKKLQLEYWSQLKEYLEQNSNVLKPQKALPQHWTNFAIGRSNFHLSALVNTEIKRISVLLALTGSEAKPHFHLLHQEKEDIEREIGSSLDWRELPNKKESHLFLEHTSDPTDRSLWPQQHKWLKENLESFYRSLAPRVKTLNADEYQTMEDNQ